MEKIPQTGKRCCHLHQTHFESSHRRRQKIRNSKGFCEDNLPSVNVRTEQSREGRDRHCFQFRYSPLPHQADDSWLLTKINAGCCSNTRPGSHKHTYLNSSKKRMLPRKAASSYQLLGSASIHHAKNSASENNSPSTAITASSWTLFHRNRFYILIGYMLTPYL